MFYTFKLTCNMRVIDEDITFPKFVLDVGNRDVNDNNDNINNPEWCITTDSNFINFMHGHLNRRVL